MSQPAHFPVVSRLANELECLLTLCLLTQAINITHVQTIWPLLIVATSRANPMAVTNEEKGFDRRAVGRCRR